MFLDACGDCQDVRIENDVLRWKAHFLREDAIRAGADLDLAIGRVGLPFLVECHDDHSRAVAANGSGVFLENLFAFFEAD